MNFSRRSILKFLGAGSFIAPVVNGLTSESERFQLIETPKVILAEPPKVVLASSIPVGEYDAAVYLRERATGKTIRWDCTLRTADLRPLQIKSGHTLLHFYPPDTDPPDEL